MIWSMMWIDVLERRFGDWEVERLTEYLLVGQVIGFVLATIRPEMYVNMGLSGSAIWSGEYWRLLSWLLVPTSLSPIWAVFGWYLFYMYGRSLAATWGDFKYMLYLVLMFVGSVVVAFVFPNAWVSNVYLFGSVFLAFAWLYPDFRLMLFFILPVKIKWLAWMGWLGMLLTLVTGAWFEKVLVLVSVVVFGLFFGEELWFEVRGWNRGMKRSVKKVQEKGTHYMICVACGANEKSDKIFYYCDECEPKTCFCEDHIEGHVHVRE